MLRGWGFSSVVEHLPSKHKALHSVLSSGKKILKTIKKIRVLWCKMEYLGVYIFVLLCRFERFHCCASSSLSHSQHHELGPFLVAIVLFFLFAGVKDFLSIHVSSSLGSLLCTSSLTTCFYTHSVLP